MQHIDRQLLIEPVWNRNLRISVATHVNLRLLIEPVWNRNRALHNAEELHRPPFNRTSMESKLTFDASIADQTWAFNRTSMESKLVSSVYPFPLFCSF